MAKQLTNREKEILALIATAMTDREIGDCLSISKHTVISHRRNLLNKLGLKNKVDLTIYAFEKGIVRAMAETGKSDPKGG